MMRDPLQEYIGTHAWAWVGAKAVLLLKAVGVAMPELVTLAVVGCALAMMLTGDCSRWLGWSGVALFVGVAWRLLT